MTEDNDREQFSLPVTVTSIKMFADRSVGVTVRTTQEIPHDEFAEIHKSFQKGGWFVFAPNRIPEGDIPKGDAPEGRKTRVERLLGAIYVHHLKSASTDSFDDFRGRRLDAHIQIERDEISRYDD